MGTRITTETKDHRLEVRTTATERELINSAASELGGDLSSFVVSSLIDASKRVLADRDQFTLSPEQMAAWDAVNRRPARELAGLRELMSHPSPFAD